MRQSFLVVAFACMIAVPAVGQDVPVVELQSGVEFPEPFSRLVGLRPLNDGRLLISDLLEVHVSYVDFDAGTLTQLGREGSGPGEYSQPGQLVALPSDGSLLIDNGNSRAMIIDADGTFGETTPTVSISEQGAKLFRPSAADRNGLLYWVDVSVRAGQDALNETYVVRSDLAREQVDTVATLVANLPIDAGFLGVPFTATETWALLESGHLALVRLDPYRVEVIDPDGSATLGPEVSYEPIPVTADDKADWIRRGTERAQRTRERLGDNPAASFFRDPDINDTDFPDTKAPIVSDDVKAGLNDEIWVRRQQAHGAGGRLYDIFDANGVRVRQVRLQDRVRLVGFGHDSVYVVRIDRDDLEWLERYDYPVGPINN